MAQRLPDFHPHTLLRDWGDNATFRLADAMTGVCVFGATGSGKTSGPAKHLAYSYLAGDFGGLVLCAKKEERIQWQKWAEETGRSEDLVIIDKTALWRFNFLDWESSRPGEGGGLTINIVALLDEISGAIANTSGKAEKGGGDSKFWEDALHHLNTNLVELPLLAKLRISLPMMQSILNTAPVDAKEAESSAWRESSTCYAIVKEADEATANADEHTRAAFKECENYWLREYPTLSENTRSIIRLTFSIMARPLITPPLRQLFVCDTNVTPEDAFDGKIIIVDLPVQEFRVAGQIANLAWKYCFQVAVLRRVQPTEKDSYLRPVFLWADEAQNFISKFDAEYQAVARSAGGCTVYLTQNKESYYRVLKDGNAVESLLGNLQAKFFCQNSGETNVWASQLLGERWLDITGTTTHVSLGSKANSQSAGTQRNSQKRAFVEPARFTTLKRGGYRNNFQVEAIVYNGGSPFVSASDSQTEALPYTLLTFNQRS